MLRIGINRALWIFGGVQMVSILGFWILALLGKNMTLLFVVISFEYFGVGLVQWLLLLLRVQLKAAYSYSLLC